jgi:hypothetical protein
MLSLASASLGFAPAAPALRTAGTATDVRMET